MQLSLKPKIFSHIFVPFLKYASSLKHLEIKMIVIATLFPKLQTVKDLVKPLFKKDRFGYSFDNEHVKESKSLVKSG